jgi:hypothetical protein
MPWCIASATDGFNPGEISSIEHAQDSLIQACTVVSIGMSDIGVRAGATGPVGPVLAGPIFWQESGCAYFINQCSIEHARFKWAWSYCTSAGVRA